MAARPPLFGPVTVISIQIPTRAGPAVNHIRSGDSGCNTIRDDLSGKINLVGGRTNAGCYLHDQVRRI